MNFLAKWFYKTEDDDFLRVRVKFLDGAAKMPDRANPSDAGADLFSTESLMIQPGERKTVSTGVAMEILNGYYGRVAPRSGLASKHGVDVLAGVVDSSYRGEIKVVLLNTDRHNTFFVEKGNKIAQIIFESHFNFCLSQSDDLSGTSRGWGGFGSTGK